MLTFWLTLALVHGSTNYVCTNGEDVVTDDRGLAFELLADDREDFCVSRAELTSEDDLPVIEAAYKKSKKQRHREYRRWCRPTGEQCWGLYCNDCCRGGSNGGSILLWGTCL